MIICSNIYKEYTQGHGRKRVLNDLNLVVQPGDRLALLGRNGAGKSTLIKLIGGVEMPTSGTIKREMSVSWPLGFAGGFQGSLTGYDNARFISRIYRRDYFEMKDFIEDFSELGAQLRMPVKTYSSGMRARLAFALSLAIEFDCYLIDEVIMVGDQNFNLKCRHELLDKRKDRTMILASHSTSLVQELCTSAIVLHNGVVQRYENVDAAVAHYSSL